MPICHFFPWYGRDIDWCHLSNCKWKRLSVNATKRHIIYSFFYYQKAFLFYFNTSSDFPIKTNHFELEKLMPEVVCKTYNIKYKFYRIEINNKKNDVQIILTFMIFFFVTEIILNGICLIDGFCNIHHMKLEIIDYFIYIVHACVSMMKGWFHNETLHWIIYSSSFFLIIIKLFHSENNFSFF